MTEVIDCPAGVAPTHIDGPAAWTGSEMARRGEWIEVLSSIELIELEQAIHRFKASGADLGDISVGTFELPLLARRLKRILQDVIEGRGFVLLRGFDVNRHSTEETAIAYLGIGAHLGSFRSQNAAGHLLGHVKDTGVDVSKPSVRFYQTNRAFGIPH